MIFNFLTKVFYLFLRVSTINSFPPPLSQEEEKRLFLLSRQGNKRAREILIEHNLRLVSHIVKKYFSSAKNQEELISKGSIGLIKAIDSFDIKKGAKFATYASKCVQNEILMYFRAQKKLSCEVSINEAIDTDKDGNALTLGDIIAVDSDIAEEIDTKLKIKRLAEVFPKVLDEREKQILTLRFGLCGAEELTQQQIANRLNISRSYVSRIEKAALKKLRPYF